MDQYLNIKLIDISVTDPEKYPHMVWPTVSFEKLSRHFKLDLCLLLSLVVSQELLHKRFGCALCAASGR